MSKEFVVKRLVFDYSKVENLDDRVRKYFDLYNEASLKDEPIDQDKIRNIFDLWYVSDFMFGAITSKNHFVLFTLNWEGILVPCIDPIKLNGKLDHNIHSCYVIKVVHDFSLIEYMTDNHFCIVRFKHQLQTLLNISKWKEWEKDGYIEVLKVDTEPITIA